MSIHQLSLDYELVRLANMWQIFRLPLTRQLVDLPVPLRKDGEADMRHREQVEQPDTAPRRQFLDVGGTALGLSFLAERPLPPKRYLGVGTPSDSTDYQFLPTSLLPAISGYGPFDRLYATLDTLDDIPAIFRGLSHGARFMLRLPPLDARAARRLLIEYGASNADGFMKCTTLAPPAFYQAKLTVRAARAYLRGTMNLPDCTLLVIRGRIA